MKKPVSQLTPLEALTEVLLLGLTAPDDARAFQAGALADEFVITFDFSPAEIELAKARALQLWDDDLYRN